MAEESLTRGCGNIHSLILDIGCMAKDFMHFYMRLVRLEASSVVDFVVVYIANHSGDIV